MFKLLQDILERADTKEGGLFLFGIFCLIALSIVVGGIVRVVKSISSIVKQRYLYLQKKETKS